MHDITSTLSSEATTSLTTNQRISVQIASDGYAKLPYNYRRLRKTNLLRMAGEPFAWPSCGKDAYYLIDPKTDLGMLCLPGGIQVFHPANHMPPGGGLHFIRASNCVILETPELFPQKQEYRKIMLSLGLTVGQFIEPVQGTPTYWHHLRLHNQWCREMRSMGPSCSTMLLVDCLHR